jgi:putative SOS response-associated peptidase YedK
MDDYIGNVCGRVIQSSGPLRYAMIDGMNVRDSRVHNYPPRWNAAPSQELLVIRRNHQTGEVSLGPLRWGLIPYWCRDPTGGRKPINAKRETVRNLPTFRDAYRKRRCIVPVDGFFEWKAIKGQKAKQPYAISNEGRRAVRHRRHLGELERAGFGRMDSNLCDHRYGCQ